MRVTIHNYSHQPYTGPMTGLKEGKSEYLAQEAAQAIGVSKATLLRWIKEARVKDSAIRNRNGWRLFTRAEVEAIRSYAQTGTYYG